MGNVEKLRQAIEQVYQSWEALPGSPCNFRIDMIIDPIRNRYVLQDVDLRDSRFRSHTLAHLEIHDGKIWILTDNTEQGIATELVALGVPKDKIVLAFYPPALREVGEFAVA